MVRNHECHWIGSWMHGQVSAGDVLEPPQKPHEDKQGKHAFGIGTLLTCSVSSAPPEGGQRQQHVSCGCDVALTLKRVIGGLSLANQC